MGSIPTYSTNKQRNIELPSYVEEVLGRKVDPKDFSSVIEKYKGHRTLITGAGGSIGARIAELFNESDDSIDFLATDILFSGDNHLDVTDEEEVVAVLTQYQPTIILHIAGAKHAPEGEMKPHVTYDINVNGTLNILNHLPSGTRFVLASTCKACNPETHYGATKMIAEKFTVNAGQTVARFFNVIETSGNVYELWREQYASSNKIEVYDAKRFFITLDDACDLIMSAAFYNPKSKYTVFSGINDQHSMIDIASRLYGPEAIVIHPRRKGDRIVEPAHATHEFFVGDAGNTDLTIGDHVQICSYHEG